MLNIDDVLPKENTALFKFPLDFIPFLNKFVNSAAEPSNLSAEPSAAPGNSCTTLHLEEKSAAGFAPSCIDCMPFLVSPKLLNELILATTFFIFSLSAMPFKSAPMPLKATFLNCII